MPYSVAQMAPGIIGLHVFNVPFRQLSFLPLVQSAGWWQSQGLLGAADSNTHKKACSLQHILHVAALDVQKLIGLVTCVLEHNRVLPCDAQHPTCLAGSSTWKYPTQKTIWYYEKPSRNNTLLDMLVLFGTCCNFCITQPALASSTGHQPAMHWHDCLRQEHKEPHGSTVLCQNVSKHVC